MSKMQELVASAIDKVTDVFVPYAPTTTPSNFPPIPDQVQVYYAYEPNVVDGDTCHMMVKGWGGNDAKLKLRLSGIDAPEGNSLEGRETSTFVKVWCASVATAFYGTRETPAPFVVIITGPDKYQPRWNAIIYNARTGECLNQLLLDNGLAAEYPKKKKVT